MSSEKRVFPTGLRIHSAVFVVSGLITVASFAQTKTDSIGTLMNRLAERGQFNGSVLIAEHGHVIYKNGFVYADL